MEQQNPLVTVESVVKHRFNFLANLPYREPGEFSIGRTLEKPLRVKDRMAVFVLDTVKERFLSSCVEFLYLARHEQQRLPVVVALVVLDRPRMSAGE